MNTKTCCWIAIVLSVISVFVVLFSPGGGDSRPKDSGNSGSDGGNAPKPVAGPGEVAESEKGVPEKTSLNKRYTKDHVDRLPANKQDLKGLVEITGKAARANCGLETSGDFYYVTEVAYESEVKERKVLPGGEIKVVEKRRYTQCSDRIVFGDFDVKVDLETLPIRQVATYVTTVAVAIGAPESTALLVEESLDALYAVDGLSFKKTMSVVSGFFGSEAPDKVSKWVEKLISPKMERLHAEVKQLAQKVSGNTYNVTYYQDSQGNPMSIMFKRDDGSSLSMEEYRVLREMNVFLSCNLVPSKSLAVGEPWDVDVGDLPGVFESLSGGSNVSGKLTVSRLKDTDDGLWQVDLSKGRVAVLNDETGMEDGSFEIDGGNACFTPDYKRLAALQMTGSGKLRLKEVQKRFIVFDFIKRTEGDCSVRMMLTTKDSE